VTFRSQFTHRDDLLRAALDEFCERGFDTASINTILANTGVSKGQLYHHFMLDNHRPASAAAPHAQWQRRTIRAVGGPLDNTPSGALGIERGTVVSRPALGLGHSR
jgi:hypothetical protein